MTAACVCRFLPLTCLAPDIVEAILDGRQPKGLRLAEVPGNGPLVWKVQRETRGFKQLTRSCSERFDLGAAQLVLKLKQTAGQREVSTCLSGLCTEAAVLAGEWDGRI